MGRNGSGFLCGLLWSCAFLWPFASGGLTVDWTLILALFVAVVLVVYLGAALLNPEKFS